MGNKSENNFKAYFLTVFLVMVFFLFYVYENIHVIKLGYQLQRKNDELFKLTLSTDMLNFKLGELTALERLDKIARGKLGLRFPNKDEVVLIEYAGEGVGRKAGKYIKL